MYNPCSSFRIRCFPIVTSLFKKLVSVRLDRARHFASSLTFRNRYRQLGFGLAMQAQNTGSSSPASFLCIPKSTLFIPCCCFATSSVQGGNQACPPVEAGNHSSSGSSTLERNEDCPNVESRAAPEHHRFRLVHHHSQLCLVSPVTFREHDFSSTLTCSALTESSCPSWHSSCQSASRRNEPKGTSCSSPAL